MKRQIDARAARARRQRRIRARISGTAGRPRLNIFRSLNNIYAQVIDDATGTTIVSASTLDPEVRGQRDGKSKSDEATLVGTTVANRAKAKGIDTVVFDRGGYLYHGRVKALAEAARAAGLRF